MKIIKALINLPSKTIAWCCAAGFVIMMISGSITEAYFAQVHYPDSGFGGVPLTFDLELKETNLDTLAQQDTLELFTTVQYIDFGIVVGTLIFFTFLALLLTKPFAATSIIFKLGSAAALSFLIAPLMDALENISILVFIASGQALASLNLLNSCFTLGKIAFFAIGWLLTGGVLMALIVSAVRKRVRFPQPSDRVI